MNPLEPSMKKTNRAQDALFEESQEEEAIRLCE